MDETPPPLEQETVPKSLCKSALSLSIGVAMAFILGMIPFLNMCCLNFVIASVVTVWHFTKTNQVTLRIGQGIKTAFLACFVGSLLLILVTNMVYYNQHGLDLGPIKEALLRNLEQTGYEEMAEKVDITFPSELTPGLAAGAIFFQIVIFALSSLVGAAIGGSLAANRFKYGPLVA